MADSERSKTVSHALSRARGRNNEGVVALAIAILVIVVGSMDRGFWSLGTIFNVLHNSYEPVIFALGVFLILLTGGIDVSFDAIGIFAAYATADLATQGKLGGNLWLMFLVSILIGLGLGIVNAIVVSLFNLSVLIVTLGTRGIFAGLLLSVIGSNYLNNLPSSVGAFGTDFILRTHTATGQIVGLQVLVIPVAIVCVLVALGLRYTVVGRGIYAVGGGEETARRAGFSVRSIKTIVFCVSGALAGAAGMVHVSLIGFVDPTDLVGDELIVIAAVVFGGASIFGGRGSVGGTVLGVLLIEVIQYSLVSLGVPSSWDDVVIGIFLVIGVSLQVAHYRSGAITQWLHRATRAPTVEAPQTGASDE